MNAHTTLSDLWKHVKTATGKRTPRAPTHPDPEREAARLLQTYVNRASPAQLSPASLAKLEEQRPAQDTFIQQACRQRHPADTAFTPRELQKALRPRPDTAAGADKITYSMIRKGALRIMLGAPRWTKLVNMRAEADLPLLAHRIHAMNTSLLAKTLSQTKYTTAARKVHQSLAHNEELFTKKTWAQKMAQGIKTLQMQTPLTARTTDAQHPDYQPPPPWQV
ncbi:hypothetical protein O3P69_011041 [Scylla paramamosain]|uniref:Uncharacterized protein n=1 Tax=Scylla paramamosain TaxID=85552 RepID=A0AAW0SSX9_SCYPA